MIDGLLKLSPPGALDFVTVLAALMLSLGLAQAVAGTYMFTFRGMSYSRSYVQGIVLGAIVCTTLMLAIGDSIAAGIGLAGGLSMIRFRTTMRDPRDMVFIFAGLAAGIVCGLRAFPAAIAGTAVFCLAAIALHFIGYGFRYPFDGLLRFVAPHTSGDGVRAAIEQHAPGAALVMLRAAGQGQLQEYAYQVRLADPKKQEALVVALQSVDGVRDVRLFISDPTQEL
jgi:hypothetical protein